VGLYLRKRKRLGPLSLNLPKRGLGLSGGRRRGRLSLGPNGRRLSFRLLRWLIFRRRL
jgi:hypothetical protein